MWREVGFSGAALALVVYAIQLVLSAAWTPIFFGLHRPDLGILDIVLVWLSIVATMLLFYPVHAGAALLLLPYLPMGQLCSGAQLRYLASQSFGNDARLIR